MTLCDRRNSRPSARCVIVGPVLVILALSGGCHTAHTPAGHSAAAALTADTARPTAAVSSIPGAAAILSGFDLAASPDDWNIGDRVLLLLRLEKAGTTTDRLLLVELTDELDVFHTIDMSARSSRGPVKLSSATATTRLTLYDADGSQIEQSEGRFPSDLLGYGLTDGATPFIGRPPSDPAVTDNLTDDEFQRMLRGWMTLFSFSGSLNRKGLFSQMLKDVVARPSLLSMLFNPSASMKMDAPGPTVGEPWSPNPGLAIDTVDVPLELTISGKPSLLGHVSAARPVAPLSLCGGVLSARAVNADTAATRLEIRLLAAARGTGGKAFGPSAESLKK